MNNLACVRGMLKNATALTDSDLEKIIRDFQTRKRAELRERAGTQDGEASQIAGAKAAEDLRIAAALERANARRNAVLHRQLLDEQTKYRDMPEWIEAQVAGSNRRVEGARDSVDAKHRAYQGKYMGGLIHDLRQAKVLTYVQARIRDMFGASKGPLDDKIAHELWELREDGKPGSSGSPEAKTIAGAIGKYQELARQDQNRLGAMIRKEPGYIVRQSHDMSRINAAGFSEWMRVIRPLVDYGRTYEKAGLEGIAGDEVKVQEFWRNAYNQLSQGEFYRAEIEDSPLLGMKGPGNIAKKASQSRSIHFKDAASWVQYNDRFGTGSLIEAVVAGLQRASRNSALMEKFGTNPRAMFERVVADARDFALRRGEKIDSRLAQGGFTDRLFDVADGTVDIPASVSAAQMASAVRAYESWAKLGGAVVSSIGDVATAAGELQYQGHGLFTGLADHVSNMLAQFSDEGLRREMAELLGTGYDTIIKDSASRMTSSDAAGYRWAHKITNGYFKLNLLSGWTDAGERALSAIMGRKLGTLKNTEWGAMPKEIARALSLYGISEKEWNVIRAHTAFEVRPDAGEVLAPDMLRSMPREAIDQLIEDPINLLKLDVSRNAEDLERQVNRLRDVAIQKLETQMRGYYADRTAVGVLKGGIREKAYTTQGAQAGTPYGEAVRFVMQFRQYNMSFVQKVLGRYAQEDRFWRIPGALLKMPASEARQFAHFIVTLTALGYLSMVLKDVAKGRVPRDPRDPRTWGAAFIQGGGAGVYGDFLFARENRFGGGFADTVLGPALGTGVSAVDLALQSRDESIKALYGEKSDIPDTQAFNFFKNNTPFLNLFYSRAALDYLILYDLQESLSPGSLRRMERRLKDQQKQDFILPPSENRVRPFTQGR